MPPQRRPFEALADPNRRAILKLLRKGSMTAGEIADAFHLTKPTLSHHFRVLKAAGLVRGQRRRTTIVYALQTRMLQDLAPELLHLAPRLEARVRGGRRTTSSNPG